MQPSSPDQPKTKARLRVEVGSEEVRKCEEILSAKILLLVQSQKLLSLATTLPFLSPIHFIPNLPSKVNRLFSVLHFFPLHSFHLFENMDVGSLTSDCFPGPLHYWVHLLSWFHPGKTHWAKGGVDTLRPSTCLLLCTFNQPLSPFLTLTLIHWLLSCYL